MKRLIELRKKKTHKVTAYAFGLAIFAYDTQGHLNVTMQISSPDWIDRIIGGFRGLSPEIVFRQCECSICNQNYEDCIHEEGQKYEDVICHALPKNIEFIGSSLVESPVDSKARITDLLIIEEEVKKKYIWYGFPVIKEDQRFRHIQNALNSGLITEKAVFYFGHYFSINSEGKVIYP